MFFKQSSIFSASSFEVREAGHANHSVGFDHRIVSSGPLDNSVIEFDRSKRQ
jgi:hypothetical protein